jgi:hypothetical protein
VTFPPPNSTNPMVTEEKSEGWAQPLFGTLRRFVPPRPRPVQEKCALCSLALAEEHQHLFETAKRQLHCACEACAILFTGQEAGRYRRVPRRVQALPDFRLTDAQWLGLNVPINLSFFCRTSADGQVLAFFPSPAGATESPLEPEAWEHLAAANPVLRQLELDVEALLVNRVGQGREYYLVPIDQCFKLVGLVRTHWRGLSGGTEVWRVIGEFFQGLRERSGLGRNSHA